MNEVRFDVEINGKKEILVADMDEVRAQEEFYNRKRTEVENDPAYRDLINRVLKRMIDAGKV